MNDTDIEYLDKTWNPVVGCTNGCPWCWARRQAKRQKHNCQKCYAFTPHLHPERLDEPLRKREPLVIGVVFMGDLFDPEINGEIIARCFEVMQACPRHTFVVLTKQAKRMRAECETLFENWFVRFPDGILPNVVLGVSVEDQESAERLIPELLKCPAALRIVSIEPMRGPVQFALGLMDDGVFTKIAACPNCGAERPDVQAGLRGPIRQVVCQRCGHTDGATIFLKQGLDGVIVGGQTGSGAVPMHPDWVRAVRDQCAGSGLPFFFKQWGDVVYPEAMTDEVFAEIDAAVNLSGCRQGAFRVGRKAAGRMLDGRTHDELAWDKNFTLSVKA